MPEEIRIDRYVSAVTYTDLSIRIKLHEIERL